MENKLSIRSIGLVAKAEYIRWITNPRMLILGMLLLVMKPLAVEPLLEMSRKAEFPLHALEPFIAILNSYFLLLMIPCVYLVLVSDYPQLGHNTVFVLHRTGKGNWYLGQSLFALWSILTFLGVVCLGSILMHHGQWGSQWSDTVTKYLAWFPNEQYSYASELIPSNLYNQMSLRMAVVHSVLLIGGYLFLMVQLCCLFRILGYRVLGLAVVFGIIATGVFTTGLQLPLMWAFPMANSLVWYHYTAILRAQIYPIWASYAYMVGAILVCMGMNAWALRKMTLND